MSKSVEAVGSYKCVQEQVRQNVLDVSFPCFMLCFGCDVFTMQISDVYAKRLERNTRRPQDIHE